MKRVHGMGGLRDKPSVLRLHPTRRAVRQGSRGWYCEAVSQLHLPASEWRVDDATLLAAGWHRPDASTSNWWRRERDVGCAAGVLTAALRDALGCIEPSRLTLHVGRFPSDRGGGRSAFYVAA